MLILPWPDSKLLPNAKRRLHWTKYRPAEKAAKQTGWAVATAGYGRHLERLRAALGDSGPIPCRITFYPPDRRKRDDDGMIGAFKHARDGICQALKVDDNRLRPVYEIGEPEKPGRIEFELWDREP